MKRRSFLLSLPLIATGLKALSNPKPEQAPEWIKDYALVKTRNIHAKYPLTPKECFKPSVGKVISIEQLATKRQSRRQ